MSLKRLASLAGSEAPIAASSVKAAQEAEINFKGFVKLERETECDKRVDRRRDRERESERGFAVRWGWRLSAATLQLGRKELNRFSTIAINSEICYKVKALSLGYFRHFTPWDFSPFFSQINRALPSSFLFSFSCFLIINYLWGFYFLSKIIITQINRSKFSDNIFQLFFRN